MQTIDDVPGHIFIEQPPKISGVYFLMRGTEVVYVGQSVDVLGRVRYHRRVSHAYFDRAAYIQVEPEKLIEQEEFWIRFFQPVENSAKTPWSRNRNSQLFNRLQWNRDKFGTPTILELALTTKEKEWLVSEGVFTVRKLARNPELRQKFAAALERFTAHRSIH